MTLLAVYYHKLLI